MTDAFLDGRIAVVTGASRGIGRAIALALADAGADVALVGRKLDTLVPVADEVRARGRRALPVAADVTRESDVARLFATVEAELGALYALVNNCGALSSAPLVETTLSAWSSVLDTNLTGTFLCMREAGPAMLARGEGKVVNVASTFGLAGVRNYAAYCASKAAVLHLTRVAALEWAGSNVQVNAIAPGYVETDMNSTMRADTDMLARTLRGIPAHRMASVEEIAGLVLQLLTPYADFVVGATLVVDGGESIR